MKKKSRSVSRHWRPLSTTQTKVLLVCGYVGVGVLVGAVGTQLFHTTFATKARPLRESDFATSQSEYEFIDPLIGTQGVDDIAKYTDIKNEVSTYITSRKKQGLISASVDFRDINEPGGFVINPDEAYTPASLNKVPVMMAYFKLSESKPSILSDEITYTGTTDSVKVQDIRSAVALTPGATYSVEQLIEHMIRYSDNNAVDLLLKHLDDTHNGAAYIAVFSSLGIDPEVLKAYTDNVTAQQYSIFLRALYNATYLNRTNSERALKLMSETDFNAGIEAGVPNIVRVSQKFGEVKMTDSSGTQVGKQINNCGIVYYPKHPYLLCIMTKATGNDIAGLEQTIATISHLVYVDMQKRYP